MKGLMYTIEQLRPGSVEEENCIQRLLFYIFRKGGDAMNGRAICEFPNYTVTKSGDVVNQNGIRLKGEKSKNGYMRVSLSNDSVKHKRKSVHRLVAEAYIPNPNNLPHVHHINENKCDNRVENLMWVSALDNLLYSGVIDRASTAKFTPVRCVTTGQIFDSIREAAAAFGIHHSNIVACCNKRRSTCGGMEWEYYIQED